MLNYGIAQYVNGVTGSVITLLPPVLVASTMGAQASAVFYLPWLFCTSCMALLWNIVFSLVVEAVHDIARTHHLLIRAAWLGAAVTCGGGLVLGFGAPCDPRNRRLDLSRLRHGRAPADRAEPAVHRCHDAVRGPLADREAHLAVDLASGRRRGDLHRRRCAVGATATGWPGSAWRSWCPGWSTALASTPAIVLRYRAMIEPDRALAEAVEREAPVLASETQLMYPIFVARGVARASSCRRRAGGSVARASTWTWTPRIAAPVDRGPRGTWTRRSSRRRASGVGIHGHHGHHVPGASGDTDMDVTVIAPKLPSAESETDPTFVAPSRPRAER